jgi:hypothetical protein
MGVLILAVLALALPASVSAAYPRFDVINIVADESVTIRGYDFPANMKFVIRMDVSGNRAENGIAVAEFNTGQGGSFDAKVMIPTLLKGVRTIAIRLDSAEGYFTYNWFTNNTSSVVQPDPIPVTGGKPTLTFTNVKANETVTVEARNLPANTTFTVRVGPYYTFFREYVTAPSIKSDANGYAAWTITLPSVVDDVEMVTVRLDGGGRYAFNAFKNVTGGTTGTTIPVTGGSCQLVSTSPSSSVSAGADLDVSWSVKNTGTRTWDVSSVDYKYVSGTKLQKRGDRYDMLQSVKSGETVKLVIDVVAPNSAGSYTTNWALIEGNNTICNLSYTLRVK